MNRFFLFTLLLFFSGCASPAVKREDVLAQALQIKAAQPPVERQAIVTPPPAPSVPEPVPAVTPVEPAPQPVEPSPLAVPERLVYKAKFIGIPVGNFIVVNRGLTELNGRAAYRLELTVSTIPFLGRIKDLYVTHMDAQTLACLRHEEYVKGKLESTVDFDYDNRRAVYVNAVTGARQEVPIPGPVHDILTGGFFLRTQKLAVGDTMEFDIYADEKVYNYLGLLQSQTKIKVAGRGKQDALVLQSHLFRNGEAVKGINADVLFSTDGFHMPYRAILRTIVGSVSVVLQNK